MDYDYESIELKDALELLAKREKVYIKNPYTNFLYDQVDSDLNPDLTWGEIAHVLLHNEPFFKRVKK